MARRETAGRTPATFLGGTVILAAATVLIAGCSSGSSGGGAATRAAAPQSTTSTTAGPPGITAVNVSLPAGTPGKGKPTIVLGDKNFPEEYLIGDLYEQALQAKGYTVDLKQSIGGSEIIDRSFSAGQIDLYPEYLAALVNDVADEPLQKTAQSTYDAAKEFEANHRDATILKQTPFQDVDVAFVKSGFAKKYHLKSIGDLTNVGPHGQGVVYVDQPPGRTRITGFKGLQEDYGLTKAKFLGAPPGQQYEAIDDGDGNVGDAFSTDPAYAQGVRSGKYVPLKDPKGIMGFEHLAPVVKTSVVTAEGPAFTQTLNWVDSLLSLKAMQTMDIAVQSQHHSVASVAEAFLKANGLT